MDDIKKDLRNRPSDYAHAAIKSAFSAIPIVGGGISELFNLIIAPPASKRRDKWLISIGESLRELNEKRPEFDVNTLINNELFITALLQATQVAIRNHQEEKLVALRNAVLNSVIQIDVDESIQIMFLNMIDTMTPWHLRILKLFQNPVSWFHENNINITNIGMSSLSHLIERVFVELRGKRAFYDLIVKDLHRQGLLGIESIQGMMTESGIIARRTTELGNHFLNYISEPFSEDLQK